MSEDKDVNPVESPSPSTDVTPSAPSAEQTPQPEQATEAPPSAATSKTANREALIAKLTAKKEQDSEQDEPEQPADEVVAGEPEQPSAKKDDAETPPETPVVVDEPSDDELKKYSENAQNRIRQALKRAKDAEATVKNTDGLARFGADILDRAQKVGIPPNVFVDWVDTGAEIYSNPAAGAEKLVAMAQSMGWKPPTAGVPDGFDKLLSKLEEDLEISPEAAQTLRARLKPAKAETTPTPPPVTNTAPPAPAADKAAMDRTVAEMNRLGGEYSKVHGAGWKDIEAAAAKELEKHKGAPPGMWPGLFRDAVELVVAKRKASAPPLKSVTKTLRPTTAPPGKEAPKNNRDRVLQKYSER